jgi:hypothetical protein
MALTQVVKAASVRKAAMEAELGSGHGSAGSPEQLGVATGTDAAGLGTDNAGHVER